MDGPKGPDFFVLGAAKSGTTSLYHYLAQHPDVYFSEPKEPVFFESQYERGLDFYRRTYFAGWSGETAVGEARSYHLYLPFVPARIHRHFPEARLMAVLRDPVERAYSHWWHRFSRRLERRSFADAVAHNLELLAGGPRFVGEAGAREWAQAVNPATTAVAHPTYLDLGYYAQQLERYRALFPADRLRVLLFEDLSHQPGKAAQELWAWLGLDPEQPLADESAQNRANEVVQSPLWRPLARVSGALRLPALLPRGLKSALRRGFEGTPARRPPLDPALRDRLRAHFEPHVRELAALLDRDLSGWLGGHGP